MTTETQRVLVTGAGGFIGSHLTETLVKKGARVTCLIKPGEDTRWIDHLDVIPCEGDILKPESLLKPMENVSRIYHLAARMGGGDNPQYVRQVNYQGSKNLIDMCLRQNLNLNRFLLVSSIAAMGQTGGHTIQDEGMIPNPGSTYGRSKLMAEEYLSRSGLPYTIVRLPLVYGPRSFRGLYSVFKIVSRGVRLKVGTSSTIVGYIDDIVRAMILAAENSASLNQTYILGEDRVYSSHQIFELIARAMDRKTVALRIPYPLLYFIVWLMEKTTDLMRRSPILRSDSISSYLNSGWRFTTGKITRELNFQVQTHLPEGARKTAPWYREKGLI